jgi:hypothetical protein
MGLTGANVQEWRRLLIALMGSLVQEEAMMTASNFVHKMLGKQHSNWIKW